jgi:SAM-dependent methyltransferase
MTSDMSSTNGLKAARCGEPSYIWRSGQERRLRMIIDAAGNRLHGSILDNGCGVGQYSKVLLESSRQVISLDFDFERAVQTHQVSNLTCCAAGEALPFTQDCFDLILSHEVLEHVQDDRQAITEMVRTLNEGGRMVLFVPNRGYPFETHGIYWRGEYHFGNIPLINYLPDSIRNKLAPHVRVYSRKGLDQLLKNLPVRVISSRIIFGAYDNLIARWPRLGRIIRKFLQSLENTPFQIFGLSHFCVIEKSTTQSRAILSNPHPFL